MDNEEVYRSGFSRRTILIVIVLLGAILLLVQPDIFMSLGALGIMVVVALLALYAAWRIVSFLFFFLVMIAGGFIVLGVVLWLFP